MENKIHYITEEGNKFIISKTKCGKEWDKVEEFTSILEYVTCEKCKQKKQII
jgi:hypothetical protein